jgi:metal-responsive CopG/Arc/MetJ family transcriptional regulator
MNVSASNKLAAMKRRITISIDSPTLDALDQLAEKFGVPGKRSELMRRALAEFVAQDTIERAVITKHRSLLARQAKALVAEQANT